MRLSEIKQPFTILCGDNETLRKVVDVIKDYFAKGRMQQRIGIMNYDTIVNIPNNIYYTQKAGCEEVDVYQLTEINELKHLSKNI